MEGSKKCAEYLLTKNVGRCMNEIKQRWISKGRFTGKITILDATKEEINEAIFNLEKTMNALKKVDSSTKDDNTSKGNTSSKDNQVITSTTKNDKKQSSTAKTGDETNIILFVSMAFMSWLGIKKVKKEEL